MVDLLMDHVRSLLFKCGRIFKVISDLYNRTHEIQYYEVKQTESNG